MSQDQEKQRLIQSLLENPTSYELEVLDNSMLPDDLKEKETINITVKPPSLEVLSKCALISLKIPEKIREADPKDLVIEEVIKYAAEMSQVLAILVHGKRTDYPEWMPLFLSANLTAKDLYYIFYESMLKLQTDFFLNSIQIASQNNPMMMMKEKKKGDSIPIDS